MCLAKRARTHPIESCRTIGLLDRSAFYSCSNPEEGESHHSKAAVHKEHQVSTVECEGCIDVSIWPNGGIGDGPCYKIGNVWRDGRHNDRLFLSSSESTTCTAKALLSALSAQKSYIQSVVKLPG